MSRLIQRPTKDDGGRDVHISRSISDSSQPAKLQTVDLGPNLAVQDLPSQLDSVSRSCTVVAAMDQDVHVQTDQLLHEASTGSLSQAFAPRASHNSEECAFFCLCMMRLCCTLHLLCSICTGVQLLVSPIRLVRATHGQSQHR